MGVRAYLRGARAAIATAFTKSPLVFAVAMLACVATLVRADVVNLSGAEVAPNIAEIYVEDDGVRIVLEAYVGDLETFADLIPAACVQAVIEDCVRGFKVYMTQRAGFDLINTIQAVTYTDDPTTDLECRRMAARVLEVKWVWAECLKRLQTMFADASGAAFQEFNDQGVWRQVDARRAFLRDLMTSRSTSSL